MGSTFTYNSTNSINIFPNFKCSFLSLHCQISSFASIILLEFSDLKFHIPLLLYCFLKTLKPSLFLNLLLFFTNQTFCTAFYNTNHLFLVESLSQFMRYCITLFSLLSWTISHLFNCTLTLTHEQYKQVSYFQNSHCLKS